MANLLDHPFITSLPILPTHNKDLNIYLTFSFVFVVLCAILDVVYALRTAWRTTSIWRDRTRAGMLRRRQLYLFLTLSLLAFVVVNGLRFEHHNLKLGPWKDRAEWMKELQRRVEAKIRRAARGTQGEEEMPDGPLGRAYMPNITVDSLWPSKATYRKLLESAAGFEEEILAYLRNQLPFFEHDWLQSQSFWDQFKMLVSNPRRFWWLQQWLMGWVGWAVFVGVECRNRGILIVEMMAFIILSYVAGLASVQCLFFALLVMKSSSPRRRTALVIRPGFAMFLFVVETAQVIALPFLLRNVFEPTKYRIFSMVQVLIIVQPVTALLFSEFCPDCFSKRIGRQSSSKAMLTYVWWTGCLLSTALHWLSSYHALVESKTGTHLLWQFGSWKGEKSTFQGHANDIKNSWSSIFAGLGDHHYINALGFDVVLSAVALACWSVIGSLDAGSMLKCSVLPCTQGDENIHDVNTVRRSSRSRSRVESYALLRSREFAAEVKRRHSTHPARLGHGVGDEEAGNDWDSEYQPPKARRGRPAKASSRARSSSRPRSVSQQSPGRARKTSRASVSPSERESFSDMRRRETRATNHAVEAEEMSEVWLKPALDAVAAEGEAAAVALGLFVVGGLGAASGAVFGAEEMQ